MLQAFDKMDNQIKTYISKDNVDYALLISGKWGCGKTYYIKDLIKDTRDRKFIYYSLNGVTDISEIVNSIFLEMFLGGKHKKGIKIGSKFYPNIVNIFKNKSDIAKIISNFGGEVLNFITDKYVEEFSNGKNSKPVIVLDDLERISEGIDITDLLGVIHNKFVLNNIKVIYVADEDKIKAKTCFDNEKEKYIQRVITFSNNKNVLFISFLKNAEIYSDDFLMVLQEVFCDGQENLRTIKFCIECYMDIVNFCKCLSKDEYNSPEKLFYSICIIGKFYKRGGANKEEIKKQLDCYYLSAHYKDNGQNKSEYEEFAIEYGPKLIRESFIYDLIYDGIFSDEALKFFLKKSEHNEDPIYNLSNISVMETLELKKILDEVEENLKHKKYSLRQYAYLRDSFLPNLMKFGAGDEDNIYSLIADSIFAEENIKELNETFSYWLRDPFSSIKKANNSFEEKLLKAFELFCEEYKKNEVENFYKSIQNCSREIFVNTAKYNNIYSELVEREYVKKLLDLPNRSINFFSYFLDASICNLVNANDFYTGEIPALNEMRNKCVDSAKNTNKDDWLRIEALDKLKYVLEHAVKHIEHKNK